MIGLPRGHIFLLISFVPKTSVFCVAYFVLLMCDPLLLDSSCGLAGVSASNLVVGFTSPAPIHFLTGSYSSNAGLLVISVSSTTSSVIRYGKDRYHVDEFIRVSMRNSETIHDINLHNFGNYDRLASCDMIGAAGHHAVELWSDRKYAVPS